MRPGWFGANYKAHPLRFGVESWMPQNAPDVVSNQIVTHIEENHAIPFVYQPPFEKICIESEKSGSFKSVQQRNNLVVSHSIAPGASADLVHANAPFLQEGTLFVGNILVDDIHADCFSSPYSVA